MNGAGAPDPVDPDVVEVDPSGRYGRYSDILGKGSSKTVYRAFDEYEGIEVAWNQVKLCDFLHNPEDLQRLYCEIHLLKTLKHDNIMKFYASWVDTANRKINFVTEMFTSGTLRQYRLKHKSVNIRAVKHWCRQILKGLLYLHGHDPPVIHRDLKCDNIFVNGHQGEVKIGDLGLAAILRKSHAARCVGTPEFMAPEIYEEEYNELVDIYSFGMCILEMVTFEYPYSECTHPAQIYKKVISGKKPDALYKVKDPEVRRFVEKCLATASMRHSAEELLMDPFLQTDHPGSDYWGDFHGLDPLFSGDRIEENALCYQYETAGIDGGSSNVDISIEGKRGEDDSVFLRLRIADDEGRIRNIYFPFDIETDTALSVATELVAELDITDQDVTMIADMIDGEISSLVPEWQRGVGIDDGANQSDAGICHNCASRIPLPSTNSPHARNLQFLQCTGNGCAEVHGRFEEITYQVDGPEEAMPAAACQPDGIHYADIWGQRDCPNLRDDDGGDEGPGSLEEDDGAAAMADPSESDSACPPPTCPAASDDHENAVRQELRWLKAKHQLQVRRVRDQQLGVKSNLFCRHGSLHHGSGDASFCEEAAGGSCSPEGIGGGARSFRSGGLPPLALHRATSLPVDAVDC